MFYALTCASMLAALVSILLDEVRAFGAFTFLGILFGVCYWATELRA